MSNYPKGEWEEIWTALYWNFIHKHKKFFQNNYRLKMMASILDRMGKDKLETHLNTAKDYLKKYKNT
jgi:deoxyribodipyrimidine photolyase-related protein